MTTAAIDAHAPQTHLYGTGRLLTGVVEHGRIDAAQHQLIHGATPLRGRDWLLTALTDVGLLGRGGAAFAVATKLAAVKHGRHTEVLVNASESEPASLKDRTLMLRTPHVILDGALVVAQALGTERITLVAHDESALNSMRQAVGERPQAHQVKLILSHDGFVAGEMRALIAGLNGQAALPPGRRVLPHVAGVNRASTFASNAETFAQIGTLARLGSGEFRRIGSADEPGTILLTLVGDVPHPGVCEVPLGVPMASLLPGPARPVLLGGYHGTWVGDLAGLTLTHESARAHGATLGAGVIARPPAGSCAVHDVVAVAQWLASESSRQCGPCTFGLSTVAEDLHHIALGDGTQRLGLLRARLGVISGRGACAHPDGSVRFISSALDAMAEDFASHAAGGTCGRPHKPFLPLPGGTT